ncbi:helix-turn-helix domain-containing protein [Streptomyces sp. NPDC060035]|uniref:helix-turn-helix domain-containing protein n=1 Tax=Streptomyces sp. NPDC060035 TaxID=3347044 RepID=UPI0036885ACF
MEVHERLLRTVASAKSQVRAVLRARIVLAAADGLANGAIARELEISVNTVRKWRGRRTVTPSRESSCPLRAEFARRGARARRACACWR